MKLSIYVASTLVDVYKLNEYKKICYTGMSVLPDIYVRLLSESGDARMHVLQVICYTSGTQ